MKPTVFFVKLNTLFQNLHFTGFAGKSRLNLAQKNYLNAKLYKLDVPVLLASTPSLDHHVLCLYIKNSTKLKLS
jgi:hypothetical protein